MRKFGLIGFPLGHSFSKKYFTEKFASGNISDCSYENYPLEHIDELPGLLQREPGLEGFNVTIPYKSEVIRFLNSVSPEAMEIGAVNVVRVKRSGKGWNLAGFNSDAFGFRESLKPWLQRVNGSAMVLGTGGSSRAVCYVLRQMGMKIFLITREPKHGAITYQQVDRKLISDVDLIVNTTPLGMFPNTESKPDIDYSSLSGKQILFDLVYNPELTSFLKAGKERGCTVISGIEMLHLQAEKAWEIWNSYEF